MTAPTLAVERAAESITRRLGSSGIVTWGSVTAQEALAAALTDPDDPDFLARTLYVKHSVVMFGVTEARALEAWARLVLTIRGRAEQHQWLGVANGLRTTLTGSAL